MECSLSSPGWISARLRILPLRPDGLPRYYGVFFCPQFTCRRVSLEVITC